MRIETPEQLARKMAEKGIGIDQAYEERTGCPWDYEAKSFEEMGWGHVRKKMVAPKPRKVFLTVKDAEHESHLLFLN